MSEVPKVKRPRDFVKKKIAFLVGYCGSAYHGLQMNPGVETVEKKLQEAFISAKGISPDNADSLSKVKWSRAARTDRGVHAAGNVISLKTNPEINIDDINVHLPSDIRIMGKYHVTKSFHAKSFCSSRKYDYLMPIFCLQEGIVDEGTDLRSICFRKSSCEEFQTIVSRANKILLRFVGTHNFHNFTIRRSSSDPSCMRYIRSCEVVEKVVHGNMEFLRIRIHGDSFMMHQIRKMMAAFLLWWHNILEWRIENEIFLKDRFISMLTAPALGLYLHQCVFDRYNVKLEVMNQSKNTKPRVEWSALDTESLDDDTSILIRRFCEENIFPQVCSSEQNIQEWQRFFEAVSSRQSWEFSDKKVIHQHDDAESNHEDLPSLDD